MKVLQICSAKGAGGGEVHVASLAWALTRRGVDVGMVVRPNSALQSLVGEAASAMHWHELPLRNAIDLASARSLAKIITKEEVDVIHAHVARDYPIAAIARGLAGRAKLVLTRHHYLPLKSNIANRRLLRDASIIAVSDSVRSTVASSLGMDPDKVTVIPNWIDHDNYESLPSRAEAREALGITCPVTVAVVGQLTPIKGQEDLVRAAADAGDGVQFLIVGDDTEKEKPYLAKLKSIVAKLRLEDRIRFLGRVEDLRVIYAAADVVVVPSWNEAFSLVTAEAMAAGKAIVASNAGALAELIEDGRTGLLVEPRNPAALASAIARLGSDQELRAQLGAAARVASARFDRDKAIDAVLEVYGRR